LRPAPLAALLLAVSLALAARAEDAGPGIDDPSPSPLPFRRSARPPGSPPPVAVPSHAAEMIFDMPMDLDRQEVRKKLEEYSSPGGRAWLAAVMRKADPYRDYVAGRIREMGLPRELLYLPVIESEYRPDAVSRSGAAGIWQFMRNSISGYGMRIDEWRDDRRDFMKSTDAALKKLKYNHSVLKDWRLAVAAYNHGLNGMKKAIAKAGTGDFWELCEKGVLPAETARYVPKFMAVAAILSYGGRLGLDAAWPDASSWAVVDMDRPVDLGLLASEAGLAAETLRAANAELRYNVTPPGGAGWALKVRAEDEDSIRAVLNDPSTKLIRYYLYQVKSGDTLSALSRHYGVPVTSILSSNPGLKPSLLRIGSAIVIPAMKDVSPYEGKKAGNADIPFTGSYTVAKGDSLWSISLRYGVQPELLAERNGLGLSSILREGSALKVPINE
jgi:membrane-bound lytic murein transglycosylase D